MEKLTPQQAEAKAKSMLTYLRGITEEAYGVTITAGVNSKGSKTVKIGLTLDASDIKSAPPTVKAILPVPEEKQKHARRYETTLDLPNEGSRILWLLKPIVGNQAHNIVSYGIHLHAAGTEMEWIKTKLETRKKSPSNPTCVALFTLKSVEGNLPNSL